MTLRAVRNLLPLLFAGIFISGCTPTNQESGPIRLEFASITGGDGVENEGAQETSDVYPGTATDALTLHWDVAGGLTPNYITTWYISADAALNKSPSPNPDVVILQRNCGGGQTPECRADVGFADCIYGNDVSIKCAGGATTADLFANRSTSLSNYFANNGGLPRQYYLIVEVSEATNSNSDRRVFSANFY